MQNWTALAVLSVLLTPAAATERSCGEVTPQEIVSKTALPLNASAFEAVHVEMSMWEIIKRLGPAGSVVASRRLRLFILDWSSTDGRVFRVVGTGSCYQPLYAGFVTDVRDL